MRVLITGAGGQLAVDLVETFANDDVLALSEDELDIVDEAAVADAVATFGPDVVVNAAAWTDVEACEDDEDRAHQVNAIGAWWLARACHSHRATLVHVSTDYVFDGLPLTGPGGTPRPYTEFDPVRPINVYGRSKAAGEQLIRQTLPEHHIVRTAWLNGASGNNFVRAILRLADEREELEVVDDQTGSPTFTRDLATAILELSRSRLYGTVHRTNSGSCTWFEFAETILEFAGRRTAVLPATSESRRQRAARPRWSVLSDQHALASGLTRMRPWQDALRDLLFELRVV